MKKLAVGIVGLGHWGKRYLETLQRVSDCRILLCDVNGKSLPTVNASNIVDYDTMLASKDVDAVIIATPDATHYQLGRRALLYGKDVLVEKPMALNVGEAEDLVITARKMNRILAVAHTPLFSEGYQWLRNELKNSRLASVVKVEALRTSRGRINESSPLWDLASHDIAIGISLFGKPRKITLQLNSHRACKYELTFSNNILFTGEARWEGPPFQRKLTVITEDETYQFEEPVGIIPSVNHLPLTALIQDFIQCCLHRQQPINNGELGKEVVACLEKLARESIMEYEIISDNTRL